MKRIILTTLLALSVGWVVSMSAVRVVGSVEDVVRDASGDAVDVFLRTIGDYFSVPQKEVAVVKEQNIPNDEISVIFFIAQQAGVSAGEILDLRKKGMTWQQIINSYSMGSDILYVPINENVKVGPPYGHAYGYYKNKPKKEWRNIKLRDDDIVNLVNLKFISGHYNYPAEKIMKMREKNNGFYNISYDIEEQREANRKRSKATSDKKERSNDDDDNDHGNKKSDKQGGDKGHGKSGDKGHKKGK